MARLKITGLHKFYGTTHAVRGVSWSVARGATLRESAR